MVRHAALALIALAACGEARVVADPPFARDGGSAWDAGFVRDAAASADAGRRDGGLERDAGFARDAGPERDGGTAVDAGLVVVLAGDSWSTGFVAPTQDAFVAAGYADVALRWEHTANAGSRAAGWRANEHPPAAGGGRDTTKPRMLDALDAALAGADVLLLVIGGNDMLFAANDGLGERPELLQRRTFDAIEADVAWLADHATTGRPDLDVVIVGYDFLHFELMDTYADFPGMDRVSFNEAMIELERRRRAVAEARPRVHFAHNLGLLQHTFGDVPHPPFPVPLVAYEPGVLPAPGWAPQYDPFPGGSPLFPAPLDHMPDGLHPTPVGFRTLMDHVIAQGLGGLFEGRGWVP